MTTQKVRPEVVDSTLATLKKYPDQPLDAQEVSFASGVEVSAVRRALNQLRDDGTISSRSETEDERSLRFGGKPLAAPAQLWFVGDSVPARTERHIIPGYTRQRKTTHGRMNHTQLNTAVARTLANSSVSWEFTGRELSAAAGVNLGSLSHRLREWRDAGLIECINDQVRYCRYRVTNHQALLDALGYVRQNNHPAPVKTVTRTVDVPDTDDTDPIKRVRLSELKAVAARVRELEAENAALKSEIAALRENSVVSLAGLY